MMRTFNAVARSCKGVAALEFAIAAPVVLVLLFGLAQTGLVLFAKSGLQQGVEAGARYASIYPRPNDAQIAAKVLASTYGLERKNLLPPKIVHGTDNNVPYAEITLLYSYRFDLAFVSFGPFDLVHTRRVYQV